jgi:hypothetical protein
MSGDEQKDKMASDEDDKSRAGEVLSNCRNPHSALSPLKVLWFVRFFHSHICAFFRLKAQGTQASGGAWAFTKRLDALDEVSSRSPGFSRPSRPVVRRDALLALVVGCARCQDEDTISTGQCRLNELHNVVFTDDGAHEVGKTKRVDLDPGARRKCSNTLSNATPVQPLALQQHWISTSYLFGSACTTLLGTRYALPTQRSVCRLVSARRRAICIGICLVSPGSDLGSWKLWTVVGQSK